MLLGEDKRKVQVNQKLCRISEKILPEIRQNLKVYLCLIIVTEGKAISIFNADLWNLALVMYSSIPASHHIQILFS